MTPMEEVEVLRASCCVAAANGDCTENERAILQRLANNVGVGKASFDAILARASTDPEFHKQQFQILKSQPKHAMEILLEVAVADKEVDVEEAKILRTLADNLELSQEDFDAIVQSTIQKLDGV